MFAHLRQQYRDFSEATPGSRFVDRHRRNKTGTWRHRLGSMLAGIVVFVAGIAMLIFPGPGIVGMLLGLALLSGESERVSRWLDRLDVAGHRAINHARSKWRRQSKPKRVLIGALVLVGGFTFTATGTFLTFRYLR